MNVGILTGGGDCPGLNAVIRAARDPAHHCDPAGVAAHHLDDHDAVVRLRGRVQSVDRLGGDPDRGVEAERVVGRAEVVVNGLGHANDGNALGVQPCGDAQGVLAADGDERVDAKARQVVFDPHDAAAAGPA